MSDGRGCAYHATFGFRDGVRLAHQEMFDAYMIYLPIVITE